MSYSRRHRWFPRLALGLAVASVMFVGRASVAAAKVDEGTSAAQQIQVIPYLSHGILTQEQADATDAQAGEDPYLSDVNVRPGESLGGPDGGPVVTRPQATRVEAETQKDDGQNERVWTDRD